jgi:hypothetical protein
MALNHITDMDIHEIYDHMKDYHKMDLTVGEMKLFDLETVVTLHEIMHRPITHHHTERNYERRVNA